MTSYLSAVSPQKLRQLYDQAVKAGCTLELTKGHHIKVVTPGGKAVFGSSSSGDRRVVHLARAKLRRAGVDV